MKHKENIYKHYRLKLKEFLFSPPIISNLRIRIENQRAVINKYISEIASLNKERKKWQQEKLYLKDKIKKLKNNNLSIHRQLRGEFDHETNLRIPYE